MRIVFLGTGDIGLPSFRALIDNHQVVAAVTQPDKPAGRRQELLPSAIKVEAMNHGLPVLQPQKIRDAAAIAQLRELAPEVIVVMAYGQILPRAVLDLPTIACLNLHASLLPRHRGAAPIQAAIEAGDRETGITVMHMAEGLDTGDMILKEIIPIRRRETGGSLHDRLALIAPKALKEALALLVEGRAPRIPQNPLEATYASKLIREHGEIRWNTAREEIDRKIRAMNPWPSAYTWMPSPDGPRKLKVFSCIQYRRMTGPAGQVLRADKRGILVGAESGAILLREVQLEGKRRMSASELLHGHPLASGTILGRQADVTC
jgi:methionyl-tRNA formyltransferase